MSDMTNQELIAECRHIYRGDTFSPGTKVQPVLHLCDRLEAAEDSLRQYREDFIGAEQIASQLEHENQDLRGANKRLMILMRGDDKAENEKLWAENERLRRLLAVAFKGGFLGGVISREDREAIENVCAGFTGSGATSDAIDTSPERVEE